MTFQSRTLSAAILDFLLEHRVSRVGDLPHLLYERYGVVTTAASIRTTLVYMARTGRVVNFARGAYCLPGREPVKVPLDKWVRISMARLYPDAVDASTLCRRHQREQGYPVPADELDRVLYELKNNGVLLGMSARRGVPYYQWPRSPSRSDLGFTDGPVNPFSD